MKLIIDRATYNGSGASFELSKDTATAQYATARLISDKNGQVCVFTVNIDELIAAMRALKG